MSGASDAVCRRLVEGAVAGDPQFVVDEHGFWRVASPKLATRELSQTPFTIVHVLRVPSDRGAPVVVELAARRLHAGRLGDALRLSIKPDAPLAPDATRLTGLTLASLYRGRKLPSALKKLRSFGEQTVWVAPDARPLLALFDAHVPSIGKPVTEPDLSLFALMDQLAPGERIRTVQALAARFGIACPEVRRAESDLAIVVEAFTHVLDLLAKQGIKTIADALACQHVEVEEVDFAPYAFDREFLRSLPEAPGVYLMKDAGGEVIYVGKAKNLRSRVNQYFAATAERDEKTQGILDALRDVEIEETATELDALVREAQRIREHEPRFNTQRQVHVREAPRAKGNDLILVCPGAEAGRVDVLFTSRGELLERFAAGEDDLDAEDLVERIDSHYFGKRGEPGDGFVREITASWVEANRERAITIDVALCEGAGHAAQLIVEYAADILAGEQRAFRI